MIKINLSEFLRVNYLEETVRESHKKSFLLTIFIVSQVRQMARSDTFSLKCQESVIKNLLVDRHLVDKSSI